MSDFRKRLSLSIREAAPYIAASIAIFSVGVVMGAANPVLAHALVESLREFAGSLKHESGLEIAVFIFGKNVTAMAAAVFFGLLAGIFPAWSALMNGAVVGAMVSLDWKQAWLLLPHGIIELPAAFLAWGTGMWLGAALFSHGRWKLLRSRLLQSLYLIVFVIVPALAIAAVIEAVLIVMLQN